MGVPCAHCAGETRLRDTTEGNFSSTVRSLAHGGAHSRARRRRSATLRDRFGESRGSPIVELENRPRRELASFPKRIGTIVCLSRQRAFHVGHRAPCFRPWCGGTPPRVGSRPARRGSGRGTRAPTALPYISRDPEAEVRAEAAAIPAPPEDSIPPAFANDAFGAFDKFRILTPSPTGRNCSSSPPL